MAETTPETVADLPVPMQKAGGAHPQWKPLRFPQVKQGMMKNHGGRLLDFQKGMSRPGTQN